MRNIFIPLLVALFLCGCKSEKATEYNDFLVRSIDTTMVLLLNTEDDIQAKLYDAARLKYEKLQELLDEQLQAVKDKDVFKGEVELQKATVEWLQYYKQVCEDEYKKIFEIVKTDSLTQNDMARIDELIQSSYSKEEEMHNNFITAQKAFAERYNFELKKADLFYYDE